MTTETTQTQEKRHATLGLLLDDYGCARLCDALDKTNLGRWALMESDSGSADNGGPWWRTGDNWRELLQESATQEYPDDWPAERLFDLDSFNGRDGWSSDVTLSYTPADLIDEPEVIDLDELRRECEYDPEDECSTVDALIAYKDALEDALLNSGRAKLSDG